MDEIIAAHRSDAKEGPASRWEKWRVMSKQRHEWDVIVHRLASPEMGWKNLSLAGRRDVVLTCLQPFEISDELLGEMVAEIDRLTG
ncbi:hypothetical protein F8566_44220 [Actinomadura rudentiformis]|uniref:Uncharacterized protein n=1 Tax=Actinomadura rudentiformis TaxID=359158 RepID=A0A6H9YLW0_9ACTN|nr:hypothetical protein F8566_44220 [Actinomadura rudentiformis]